MKIVSFDTESTDLKAMMGRFLCASFVPVLNCGEDHEENKPYTFRIDRKPWKRDDPIDDSPLAIAIRDELEKYNCIVSWNGKLHDVPLLNARLARVGERPLAPQFHLDLMYYAGGVSMKIGSRKLVNVQKFLALTDSKTDLDWDMWNRAAIGEKKAMGYVVEHCEQDVKVLAEAYEHMLPLVRNLHR